MSSLTQFLSKRSRRTMHGVDPADVRIRRRSFATAAAILVALACMTLTPAAIAKDRHEDGAAGRATMSTPDQCAALSTLSLPDTVITAAALVPAQGSVPAYCRVLATVEPETDIEVRLPDTW